jgi:hypothetical protein
MIGSISVLIVTVLGAGGPPPGGVYREPNAPVTVQEVAPHTHQLLLRRTGRHGRVTLRLPRGSVYVVSALLEGSPPVRCPARRVKLSSGTQRVNLFCSIR